MGQKILFDRFNISVRFITLFKYGLVQLIIKKLQILINLIVTVAAWFKCRGGGLKSVSLIEGTLQK